MHCLRYIPVILMLIYPSAVMATTVSPAPEIQPQPSPTVEATVPIEETQVPMNKVVQPSYGSTPLDSLKTWITYWDAESALRELDSSTIPLSELIYFAAYFDANDALFVPEEIYDLIFCISLLDNEHPVEYLSFVNDRLLADGGALQKDKDILRTILFDDQARQQHIDDIIAITQKTGLSAIEIDYEALVRDAELLQQFTIFVEELYAKTSALHMPLRVVLEPLVAFDQYAFPEGPEYVIMCYNLFGTHSGPGPKANPVFLRRVVTAAEALPGKKTFALAIGGYRWAQCGTVQNITFQQAQNLLTEHAAVAYRDTESGCVYFNYTDADAQENEVWYADDETLKIWIDAIQEMGEYDINIWRLGGNAPWTK